MPSLRDELQTLSTQATAAGVFIGTSSWKYPGWIGQIYEEQRYITRGKFSTSRFERDCLKEYAEVFSTVCVDAAYYKFPDVDYLTKLAKQVKPGFRFSFKVTDDITIKRFTNLPRFGKRAGMANEHFLDADLFIACFLRPCEAIRDYVGLIMFEFSHFHGSDFSRGREFMEALDSFFSRLPKGWNYGVEIRNRNFLHPDYFAMLASHGVTHIFNSWGDMPGVEEQWEMPGSLTRPDCVGARLLLKPGRKYQEAVDAFSPYESIKEPVPAARTTAAKMILRNQQAGTPKQTLIYVNNRLEGNALQTIQAILTEARRPKDG